MVEAAEGLLDRVPGAPSRSCACPRPTASRWRIHAALDTADRGLAAKCDHDAGGLVPVAAPRHPLRGPAVRGPVPEAETAAEAHYQEAVDVGSTEAQAAFATVLAQYVGERGRGHSRCG